jgi:hypothetical protein
MITGLPLLLTFSFIVTTLFCLWLFYRAMNGLRIALIVFTAVMTVQGMLAATGFYTAKDTSLPRFPLLLAPSVIILFTFLFSAKGKAIIQSLSLKNLIWIHVIRIPVELLLHWLYMEKQIPRAMTYDGFNYDIISGITAPLIIAIGFTTSGYRRGLLIAWNIICLILLINIVMMATLAVESPVQQLAFTQPNRAVLYFPFVWLPACIVPVVLFAHLATLYKLFTKKYPDNRVRLSDSPFQNGGIAPHV